MIVQEKVKHRDFLLCEITVLQKERGEYIEPNDIIELEIDSVERFTAKELCRLGEWLIENGKRIEKEYTSTGKRRAK